MWKQRCEFHCDAEQGEQMDELCGKFQLVEVGRHKTNKTIDVKNNRDFFREVKSCGVMSNDIEFDYDMDTGIGKIFVGGFRAIGTFKRIVAEA
jgi:hypothetical protein